MKLLRALGLFAVLILMLSSAALAQDTTEEPAGTEEAPAPTLAPTAAPAEQDATPVAGPGREIEIGATVEGTLGPDSPTIIYNFIAHAGDVVAITMASSDVDSYLRLGDQRGNQLLADDDGADDLDARIGPVRLPEDGAYVVIASSFDNFVSEGAQVEVGDFELSIASYEPEAISIPVEIDGALEEGEVLHLFSFEGRMGDILRITLDSDDFDPLLVLTEANNISAATIRDDDSGEDLNSLIAPYIVPVSGTYYLTAISYRSDDGGDYALGIAPLEAQPLAYGESADVSLSREDMPAAIFSFEAAEGDSIDVLVESATELDTTLTLLGPDGSQVAFNDDTTARNPALTGQALPGAGTYTLVVQPFSRGASGDITVSLAQSGAQ